MAALFTIAKGESNLSVYHLINRQNSAYVHDGYYLVIERNKDLTHAAVLVSLEKIVNKRDQIEKATYFMLPFI